MGTKQEIWTQLKNDRDFNRISHCVVENQSVMKIIRSLIQEAKKGFGTKDYLGQEFDENCDLLVIPAYSYRLLAKKLEIEDLQSAVPNIVDQIHHILQFGDVNSSVEVIEIQSNHCRYDKRTSKPARQYACFAQNDIVAGTVLGQYVGVMKLEPWESDDEDESPAPTSEYAFALTQYDAGELFVDAKNFGNEMAFINDGRPDKSRNNVASLQVCRQSNPRLASLMPSLVTAGLRQRCTRHLCPRITGY